MAVESFLQWQILTLSEVLIVVVNQMTFADQLFIESLTQHLQNATQKIIVVHNYKTVSDPVMFDKLVEQYVTNVYPGKMEEKYIDSVTTCKVFSETTVNVRHVFLCDDKSELGMTINPSTISWLRSVSVNSNVQRLSQDFLSFLLGSCQDGLKDLIRLPGTLNYYCLHTDGKLKFVIKSSETNPQMFRKVEVTDRSIILKRIDFNLESDTIDYQKDDDYHLIIDIPGIPTDPKKQLELGAYINVIPNQQKNTIIISGMRPLYSYKTELVGSKMIITKSPLFYSDFSASGDSFDEATVKTERCFGGFKREFPIPKTYDVADLQTRIESGQLMIAVPRSGSNDEWS